MKKMRGFGWSVKKVFQSMQSCFVLGIGLSQVCVVGAIASENFAVTPEGGTYLYGEASTLNQPGKEYVVFSQMGQQIVGAVYVPQSEYSCFIGKRTSAGLTIQLFEAVPQSEPSRQNAFQVHLPNLHAISQIGSGEHQVLAACQKEALTLTPEKLAQPVKSVPSKISMH